MRPTANRANIAGLDCEPVTGDMRDEDSMTAALKGARYLFHVAADYRLWARDPGEIERNNLEGAQRHHGRGAGGRRGARGLYLVGRGPEAGRRRRWTKPRATRRKA